MQGNLYVRFVINIREGHGPSAFEVEMAIGKLKRHKSIVIDQIQTELIIAGGRTFLSEITKFINSIWNREEMLEKWKESIIVPIFKKSDKAECSDYRDISFWSITYIYPSSYSQG